MPGRATAEFFLLLQKTRFAASVSYAFQLREGEVTHNA